MPVVRAGESIDWLKRYFDDGEQSTAVSVKGSFRSMDWLSDLFSVLRHYPHVKVHGLSATSASILHTPRWHFDSADSSTWLKQSSMGQMPIPRFTQGKPDYRQKPDIISVTDRATARHNHVTDLADYKRERVDKFLREHVGIDLGQARPPNQCIAALPRMMPCLA
jgi:hypothetical protein